jgi:O-antigen/teichoic acid export membrane protein
MMVVCTSNLLLTLRAQKFTTPNFDWELIRSRAKKSRALLGANVLNNLFLLTDIFVITKMVGATASGLYNTAQNIAYKPLDLILFPLGKTLMVAFGQTKDPARLAEVYWRSINAIVLLLLPLYAFIALNSSGLILLLLGEKFAGGIPVLTVLCLYLASRTLGSISGNALVPIGRHAWTLYPWALALVITTVGVVLVAPHPTLMGIVWSFTAGAMGVYFSIFGLAAYWLRPGKQGVNGLLKATLASGTSCALMLGLHYWPAPPIVRLLASLPFVGIIHLAVAGLILERDAVVFVSPSGLRRLYRAL